jgi:hypothetical protein
LTLTPICGRSRWWLWHLARRIEQGQHAHKLPFVFLIGAGHAQRTKAACREFVDGLLDGGFTSPALVDIARITCGAPLAT